MKLKSCEIKENSLAEMIIEVGADRMEAALADAFKKNRNSITVPGFRRGKAPRKMIERMFGASIFYSDALEAVMPDVITYIEENSELKTVGTPKATDVDMKEDDPAIGAEITVEIAVYPEAEVGEYKGLSAVYPNVIVSDEEIDDEINVIRQRNVRIESVDRAAKIGDVVDLNFEGFVDGKPFDGGKAENYELELGSGSFIPGFEDQMLGMTTGEERDLNLTFPENYHKNLAGKDVLFKVKVNEIKEKILPELDDEFAKDVSEFDTLDEYRASLLEARLEEKRKDADSAFENALLGQIVETMTAEVPEVMFAAHHESVASNFVNQLSAYGMNPDTYLRMTGMTKESFFETTRKQAELQVKTNLALEKIAELEKLEVSEAEVETEYSSIAERMNSTVDEVKESIKPKDVELEIKLRRAIEIIKDNATKEDPPSDTDEQPAKNEAAAKKVKKAVTKKIATDKEDATVKDAAKVKKSDITKSEAKKSAAKTTATDEKAPIKSKTTKTGNSKTSADAVASQEKDDSKSISKPQRSKATKTTKAAASDDTAKAGADVSDEAKPKKAPAKKKATEKPKEE